MYAGGGAGELVLKLQRMGLGVQLLCTTGGGSVAAPAGDIGPAGPPAAAPSPCSALLQELSRTSANVLHFECAGKVPSKTKQFFLFCLSPASAVANKRARAPFLSALSFFFGHFRFYCNMLKRMCPT